MSKNLNLSDVEELSQCSRDRLPSVYFHVFLSYYLFSAPIFLFPCCLFNVHLVWKLASKNNHWQAEWSFYKSNQGVKQDETEEKPHRKSSLKANLDANLLKWEFLRESDVSSHNSWLHLPFATGCYCNSRRNSPNFCFNDCWWEVIKLQGTVLCWGKSLDLCVPTSS